MSIKMGRAIYQQLPFLFPVKAPAAKKKHGRPANLTGL
jgi:hypothetical protein